MSAEVTFIHTSDLQLGMKYWFLEGEAQARFDQDRIEAIKALGELAVAENAAFIAVAGDVFELNSLSNKTMTRAREALHALPVPVYLLPGNHDPLSADSILRKVAGEDVHVIESAQPIAFNSEVEIMGAPYMSKRAERDIVAAALEPLAPTEKIRVMLAHGQVSSFSSEQPLDLIDLPTVEKAINTGVIDYLALGDTHSTASLSSTGAVWFSGAPETTDFHEIDGDKGENDSGNALAVTITKAEGQANVNVKKHQISKWRFEALHADLNSQADVEDFLEKLASYPDKARTVIKYGLTGTITMAAQQQLVEGLDSWAETFASLRERERTTDLALEPGEDELSQLGLSGYAGEALNELLTEMKDDEVARDAVNLLFRLSGKGA